MNESAKKTRRRRFAGLISLAAVILIGGAIGAGLSRFDAPLALSNDGAGPRGIGSLNRGFAGHVAEPFVPCSSNVSDCFSKAQFGYGPGSRAGAGRSRGPRSRLIPPRAPSFAGGLAGSDLPLDQTLSIPLAQLAEEVAPFTGGGSGARAAPQFDLFPALAGPGGIGGQAGLVPVPTPSPQPTTTPLDPDTPIPAVPEPATWLQLLIGFAIVGTFLRRRRPAGLQLA